ncbi:MAG: hypothetical protein J6568_07015 [Snodgrassella sp.]|nr:hypothetical protein [Snodgrassella sp.]
MKEPLGTQYYDTAHRLSTLNHSERYGYVYDALGRRIEKHQLDHEGNPYNRTRFLWDGFRLLQQTSPIRYQNDMRIFAQITPNLVQHSFDKMIQYNVVLISLNGFILIMDINIKAQAYIFLLKPVITIVSMKNSPNLSIHRRTVK